MNTYNVVVGNVGTVYAGSNKAEALREYNASVNESVQGTGRASDEDVTLMANGEVIKEYMVSGPKCKVLRIDAWANGDGWDWNNWHSIGEVPVAVCDWNARQLLHYLREKGYLSEASKGAVTTTDDQYNIVIVDRKTWEPLIALEYGAVEGDGNA